MNYSNDGGGQRGRKPQDVLDNPRNLKWLSGTNEMSAAHKQMQNLVLSEQARIVKAVTTVPNFRDITKENQAHDSPLRSECLLSSFLPPIGSGPWRKIESYPLMKIF